MFYATTPDVDIKSAGSPSGSDNQARSASTSSPVIRANQEPVPPSPPFVTPPTNFVFLQDTHNAVKGSWTIDTSLAPPPSFLRPDVAPSPPPTPGFFQRLASFIPQSQEKYPGPTPNLKLKSTHGKVDANVRVVRGSKESPPARLDVRSQHGSVRLAIVSMNFT